MVGARVVVAGTAVVVTGGEVVVVVVANTGRPDKAILDRSGGEQAEATSSRATPAEVIRTINKSSPSPSVPVTGIRTHRGMVWKLQQRSRCAGRHFFSTIQQRDSSAEPPIIDKEKELVGLMHRVGHDRGDTWRDQRREKSMTPTITALDAPIAALGESPVWCSDEGSLYWVDIDGRTIRRHDSVTGTHDMRSIDGRPGSIALTSTHGLLLVASEHRLFELDWNTGAVSQLADLEAAGTGNRLNDGCCDPAGRFVVGSMYADTTARYSTGMLHQIHSGGEIATLRTHIGVTNGLAFDAERGRMYFADTPTEQVLVFDYESATGSMSNQRLFFDYHEQPGKPDGACVDADGCYWSASVNGWSLLRISPEGEVTRRVELPLQKPSKPCFGGSNLDTLFVTTIGAGGGTPSEAGRDGFEPGATLAIADLGVQGVMEPRFTTKTGQMADTVVLDAEGNVVA